MRKNNKLNIFKLIKTCIIFVITISCNNDNPYKDFYLGGEIINPSSSSVNFYYNNVKIDSILLDNKNKFFKKIENLKPGIYRIEHIPENQYIIVENGDSLWIRVNVEEFKESLSFTGRGSSKNNFLIDISNYDEFENEYLAQYYIEDSNTFKEIIDSLMDEKITLWNRLDNSINQKKISSKITFSSIKYNYYNKLERYALLRGTNWTDEKKDSFFSYRKDINLNDSDLSLFETYITYLMNYFNEKTLDSGKIYFNEKNETEFNIKKLLIIDSQIKNNLLKNNLARATAIEEILNFKNNQSHEEFIDYYSYVNTSEKYLNEITQLYNDIEKMQKGKILPDTEFIDFQGNIINSNDELKGTKTLIYFWSQSQMNHYRRTIRRVDELKNLYPEYRFVGICIQPYTDMVSQAQNILNLDLSNQYSFNDFEKSSKSWVLTFLNKTIIIDQKSKIIDGFSNLFSNEIEEILKLN